MNKAQQQTKFAVEKALGKQRRERKLANEVKLAIQKGLIFAP
jgi:hypothetical protein